MCAPVYMCVLCTCECLWKSEESVRSPGTAVTGGGEPTAQVLGTEPGSSARAANSLNNRALSQAPICASFQEILQKPFPPSYLLIILTTVNVSKSS